MAFTVKVVISYTLCFLLLAVDTYAASNNSFPLPSFTNPPPSARPKFRYWLPDASVSAAVLDADIQSIVQAGAGGIELLPFYNYGQPPVSTDWSIYGFGTKAFRELFHKALNATAVYGGVLDFALGANQGAGVPSPPPPSSVQNVTAFLEGGRGLAMELVYGTATLDGNTTAVVPPPDVHFHYEALQNFINAPELWGDSLLVALLAVQVTGRTRERGNNYILLNESSVVDLTDRVHNNIVTLDAPLGSDYQLMAFYERYTNERSCVSVANASSWIGNGSWMVDHFSSAGAEKMTSFWDSHLLDETTRSLLAQVGEYSWEDSMEMMASLWWTPNLVEAFRRKRGYSPVPVLPVLFQAANLWNGYGAPYNTTYAFSRDALDGGRYAEDYRLTLNEGYQDYLAHYQTWARSQNLTAHSCQPAYNLPLDMAADVPWVGAPELESLGFDEDILNYIQFTGAAHLSGRNVVSTEIGAQRIGAYAQAVPALLKLFRDSFAAGVNTLVIHGFPYSGTYPGTTWPGYTPFQYEFGEMWGPRQPAWRHMNDTLYFAARNTLVLTTGVSRVDVAFYSFDKQFTARLRTGGDVLFNSAGYTHEFIGGENLVTAASNGTTTGGVKNGILGPEGPAYKALVIIGQHKISPGASAGLVTMAEAGLPILFVGPSPNTTVGMTGQDIVTANLDRLLNGTYPSVRTLSHGEFTASALATFGITPRVRVDAVTGSTTNASQLFTHWRADAAAQKEFVYILNRGPVATFTLAVDTAQKQAVPYVLDAWTGTQTPLFVYSRSASDGRLVVNVTLSQEQSAILAFAGDKKEQANIVSFSSNIVDVGLASGDRLAVIIDDNDKSSLQLSNGSTVSVPSSPVNSSLTSMILGPWSLSVESYAAPAVLSTASVAANKTTLTIPTPLTKLVPWTQISGLERVSGVGTYATSFRLNGTNTDDIVYTLHLTGRVLHTLRAFVNGVAVRPFDPATTGEPPSFRNGRDITALVQTNNTLVIEVSSPLFNAIKDRQVDVRSVGLGTRVPRYYTDGTWAAYGLVGEVVIKPWRRVVVDDEE